MRAELIGIHNEKGHTSMKILTDSRCLRKAWTVFGS